jgi:hypothetical protein
VQKTPALLTNRQLQQEFALGRDLATKLTHLLPSVSAGKTGKGVKRLVWRSDLDIVLRHAAEQKIALWDLVRSSNAEQKIKGWIESQEEGKR